MSEGWIKIHRSLLDNPRSRDPEWLAIWLYLLLNATHKPIKKMFAGSVIELKPGQLITGRKVISHNIFVNESKIRRVLDCMKTDQQISQQTSNASSLITILNWNQYQDIGQPNGQPAANERPASGQRTATLQECKNEISNTNTGAGLENFAVNPPTQEQFMQAVSMVSMTESDKLACYNYYNGQGWLKRNQLPVTNLASIATSWRIESENRKAKENAKGTNPITGRVNRNAGTLNSGCTGQYSKIGIIPGVKDTK